MKNSVVSLINDLRASSRKECGEEKDSCLFERTDLSWEPDKSSVTGSVIEWKLPVADEINKIKKGRLPEFSIVVMTNTVKVRDKIWSQDRKLIESSFGGGVRVWDPGKTVLSEIGAKYVEYLVTSANEENKWYSKDKLIYYHQMLDRYEDSSRAKKGLPQLKRSSRI